MLSKKGEAAGKPLAESGDLLLGVISVIVIVGVLILLFSGDSIEELVCKISVYMADQTHDVFPIICRTFDEVIDEDQTSRVKFEIADHMRKCWSMWGEGKLNPEGIATSNFSPLMSSHSIGRERSASIMLIFFVINKSCFSRVKTLWGFTRTMR